MSVADFERQLVVAALGREIEQTSWWQTAQSPREHLVGLHAPADARAILAVFAEFPESARMNRDIVSLAVKLAGGAAFQLAAEDLREDADFLLELARNGLWCALGRAPASLRGDSKTVFAVARAAKDWRAVQCCDPILWCEREFVMNAVSVHWELIKFADVELLADKSVALHAVKRCGYALRYLHEDLRADRDVVLVAVSRSPAPLRFAAECMKLDSEVLAKAHKKLEVNIPQAQEDELLTRFIPEFLRGVRIVVPVAGTDLFLIDNTEFQSESSGVSCRKCRNLQDRDGDLGVEWQTMVKGDVCDGWLRLRVQPIPTTNVEIDSYNVVNDEIAAAVKESSLDVEKPTSADAFEAPTGAAQLQLHLCPMEMGFLAHHLCYGA